MAELKEIFDMVTNKTEPEQDSWGQQEQRQRRTGRNRKLGALAVVAAIVVVAAVAFAALRAERGDDLRPADTNTSAPPLGIVTHYLVDIRTGDRTAVPAMMPGGRLFSVSPDGSAIAYSTCCSFDATWVANFDGSGERRITPDGLDGYGPTWTPDGNGVVFQGRKAGTDEIGQLYRADMTTGALTRITHFDRRTSGWWITTSDVSPDGRTVLFHLVREHASGHGAWDLWTVPITGGEPTLLRKNAGYASYGSDGTIAFIDHPVDFGGESIWVMKSDGTGARPIVEGGSYAWPRVSPDGTRIAYEDTSSVMIVEIATGKTTDLGIGSEPNWVDENTLIVG